MQWKTLWILIVTFILATNLIAQMTVKDSDSNVLMQVTDEGTKGKLAIDAADVRAMENDVLTMPSVTAPSPSTNKLYNVGGSLYWGDTALGTGASSIDGLSDGRTLGSSVYLGSDAGANDTGPDNSNVGVGANALNANTTGSGNMASGAYALGNNTEGNSNTASGAFALSSNTAGLSNTASGAYALNYNTEGDYNTANGTSTLQFNTTGSSNTASGYQALYSNTTGNNNTAIGVWANWYNEEGSNNTIIGNEAGCGTSAHNKTGNVFLGYKAGYNETGDNKLYIENTDSPTPLIGGDFDADRVDINGQIKITDGSQGDGKVLTSDASGLASWQDAGFGTWTTKDFDTNYQAATDGFVIAWAYAISTYPYKLRITGYTDGSNPPSIKRLDDICPTSDPYVVSITMPVRKGDYWRVESSERSYGGSDWGLYWISLGN